MQLVVLEVPLFFKRLIQRQSWLLIDQLAHTASPSRSSDGGLLQAPANGRGPHAVLRTCARPRTTTAWRQALPKR